jgi:hypothetical protein
VPDAKRAHRASRKGELELPGPKCDEAACRELRYRRNAVRSLSAIKRCNPSSTRKLFDRKPPSQILLIATESPLTGLATAKTADSGVGKTCFGQIVAKALCNALRFWRSHHEVSLEAAQAFPAAKPGVRASDVSNQARPTCSVWKRSRSGDMHGLSLSVRPASILIIGLINQTWQPYSNQRAATPVRRTAQVPAIALIYGARASQVCASRAIHHNRHCDIAADHPAGPGSCTNRREESRAPRGR